MTFPLEFRPCTWEGRRSHSADASHVVAQVTWQELALLATGLILILTMALMTTLLDMGTSTLLAMSGSNALSGI